MKTPPAAKHLEALYRNAGLPCEIDPGPVGIVVYGRTPAIVTAVANSLAKAPRSLGVRVQVETPVFDGDEPAETAYVAAVCFDWDAMPRSMAVLVPALSPEAK